MLVRNVVRKQRKSVVKIVITLEDIMTGVYIGQIKKNVTVIIEQTN